MQATATNSCGAGHSALAPHQVGQAALQRGVWAARTLVVRQAACWARPRTRLPRDKMSASLAISHGAEATNGIFSQFIVPPTVLPK